MGALGRQLEAILARGGHPVLIGLHLWAAAAAIVVGWSALLAAVVWSLGEMSGSASGSDPLWEKVGEPELVGRMEDGVEIWTQRYMWLGAPRRKEKDD